MPRKMLVVNVRPATKSATERLSRCFSGEHNWCSCLERGRIRSVSQVALRSDLAVGVSPRRVANATASEHVSIKDQPPKEDHHFLRDSGTDYRPACESSLNTFLTVMAKGRMLVGRHREPRSNG